MVIVTKDLIEVRNPYPKWQGDPGCCWACYVLLWTADAHERHLCPDHQLTHVAVAK